MAAGPAAWKHLEDPFPGLVRRSGGRVKAVARRVGPGSSDAFPGDYTSWRHCIEVKCGVPLAASYVTERISVLSDPTKEESKRFAPALR